MDLKVQYIKRVVLYCIGLMFIAFGVAFSINSNLGVSPVNALPYVVSLATGFNLGNCIIVVFTFYILLQVIILRNEFRLIDLTQLLFSTFFGYFSDFSKWILGDFVIPTYLGQLAMLAISIVLIATGISLYVNAKLVNMPMEGLTQAVTDKITKKPFHDTKVLIDCTVVVLAIIISLVFLRDLEGVREGTIISAFVIGRVMKPIQKAVVPLTNKYIYNEETNLVYVQ